MATDNVNKGISNGGDKYDDDFNIIDDNVTGDDNDGNDDDNDDGNNNDTNNDNDDETMMMMGISFRHVHCVHKQGQTVSEACGLMQFLRQNC